jgi:hypothetical protein
LRWSLAKCAIHDPCRLRVLECGLLWEASLLGERRLLLEASRLRDKRVCQTRGRWLELLARRVCERRAGLLALVEGLLVADAHTLLTELSLTELGLRLEACGLWLHGRELLWHLRHLGHQAMRLLLREASTIPCRLCLLELLILLPHLELLQALARRGNLRWLEASVLRLERRWWAESRLLRVEAWRRSCSGRRRHREASAGGLLCRRCWSLVSSLLRT